MTDRAAYRKRLQRHLGETKNHARQVERRIAKLGGGGHLLQNLAARGTAIAKSPMHALRGKSDEEKMLKNAKSEYSEEAEEIATYTAIETLAETVGDSETARMARQIRRDEERMASFLSRQIPVLTRAVARAELPASERNGARSRRSRRARGTRSSGK
jgi:ferritin-like metal-binding protein YciE